MTHTTLTPRHYRSKPQEFLSFLPSEMKKPKLKHPLSHSNFPSLPGPMRPSVTSPTLLPAPPLPHETQRHLPPLSDSANVFKPLGLTSAESAALEMDIPQRIKFCCLPAFTTKSHSSPNRLERDLQPLHAYRPPPVSTYSQTPQFVRFEDVVDKETSLQLPLPPHTPSTSYPCTLHQISLLSASSNIVRGYLINGSLSLHVLEQALDATANVHSLLYASFSLGDNPSFRINRLSLRAKLRLEQKSISARKPDELLEIGLSTDFSHLLFSQPDTPVPPLMRAWVYSFGAREHVLVLSFPAAVCDVYSAALFASQLCSRYSLLVKETKSSAKYVHTKFPLLTKSAKSTPRELYTKRTIDTPSFTQVAHRESTLLRFTPLPDSVHTWYRHLLMSPSSDRLVPQAKVPHSFSKEGKSALTKPRLRSALQKSASHKPSDFLAFSVDHDMTSTFLDLMLLRGCDGVPERDRLCVLSLTAYCLLLAVYFRGLSEHTLTAGVVVRDSISFSGKHGRSLQQSSLLFNHEKMQLKSAKKRESRARSEACIFTIGVSNSYRHLSPSLCSLLAPLTYLSYFRVDLYDCHTFYDFLLSIAKSLAFSLSYSHIPIGRVRAALDLKHPELQFSFLHQSEMKRISLHEAEFHSGTVELGPSCQLSPLIGRVASGCGLEMLVWESPERRGLCGGFRFDPARISKSVVQELRNKFGETIEYVATDLDITLLELVRLLT